ncbi:MAG: carbon storage regulator [Phycisphaerae bacterium]|nr:carbon storage regulator [Phycisphaerae bacterium]
MLVVTRREGEEVVIGDPRKPLGIVRIASIRGDRVRIAFEFPRDIEVNRREIADEIVEQKQHVVGTIKPDPTAATSG